jgi:large subunit ribosomal protein L32
MAVQQNKKSPSKRGMHRAHDSLSGLPLAIEPTTGEVHLRHHVSPSGFIGARRSSRVRASDSSGLGRQPSRDGELPAFSFVCQRMTITVAIDCMGGDHGPQVTVPAPSSSCAIIPTCASSWSVLPRAFVPFWATLRSAGLPFAMPRKWSPWMSRRRWRCAPRKTRRCGSRSIWSSRARRMPVFRPATPVR